MNNCMNIEYYYKNIDPFGEATKDYIAKKIESVAKIVAVRDVNIEASRRKDGLFYLNVIVRAMDGSEYRATENSASVHASIDIIEEELKSQIRRDTLRQRDLDMRAARSAKKKLTIDDKARL